MSKQKVFGANLVNLNYVNNIPYIAYNNKFLTSSRHLYYYYSDILYNKICNMFEWTGIDDFETIQMLNRCLFLTGQCTLFYDDENQLTAWYSTDYEMPDRYAIHKHHIIANPYLEGRKTFTCEDGKDCITIYNDSNYTGVASIIAFYAQILAENSKSLAIVQRNTRVSGIGYGDKRGTREQFKSAMSEMIESGIPQFIHSENMTDIPFTLNPMAQDAENLQMLTEVNQYWYSQFLLAFGIYSNYAMKKERFNTAEILVNSDLMQINIDDMLRCRKYGVDKFNEWSKTDNISVKLNPLWEQQFEKNESNNDTINESYNVDKGGIEDALQDDSTPQIQ